MRFLRYCGRGRCEGGGGPHRPSQSTQLWRALARGDTAAALKQFQDIYQGGGDPSSVLGDLLSLCRDMLMICSAPESGASLIAGAIGPEQLLELRGDIPMGRLFMASKALQETISAMASVRDKRTGAELCLIELTGILSGSAASEQPYYNEPVKKAAPAAKSQSPRREPPRDVPPPPWEDTAPSPSSQMGAIAEEAPPPWEDADIPSEDSVPWGKYGAGDMAEHEPEPDVPPEPAGVRPAAPSPQSSDSGWWEKVLSACRGSVEDTSFQFLSDHMNLSPDLNGSVLTLRAKNDFVLMMVNTPGVKSAVSQAASNILGRSVTVAAVTGLPDTGLKEDKLDRLAKFGNIKFQ